MARATTVTWLSLERYAAIMGLDMVHFNGIYTTLRPVGNCGDLWLQYAWQSGTKVSREDLASAIADAEQRIASYVGYNLLPDWIGDERTTTVRGAIREAYSAGWNIRGAKKSVETKRGYVLSGGVRATTTIQAGAAIVRSDADGDTYTELCTVTVLNTSVDACEIRAFYPGYVGQAQFEIRPITVTKVGTTATITFKIWQVPLLLPMERLNAISIDGDVAANFCTTVDIGRVYNSPATQVQMLWESGECGYCGGSGCTACELAVQDGCLTVRDTRLGMVTYGPATWDADTLAFDYTSYAVARDPDRLRLYYYSGSRDANLTCPDTTLPGYWEKAIAYFATSLLDRDICACDNVAAYFSHWREDLAMSNTSRSYQNSQRVLDNDFGTTRGALYAWDIANAPGRKLK